MPSLRSTSLPRQLLENERPPLAAVVVADVAAAFTEGPADDGQGRVFFTDILNSRILCFDTRTGQTTVWRADSGRSNGLLFDPQGRLLCCEGSEFGPGGRRRITRTDLASGRVEVLTDRFDGVKYNSPNDIAACSDGSIYFTDPCYGDRTTMQLSHESVYRIDPAGKVTRVLSQPDIDRPNGVALSPDETTLFVVDSCPTPGGNRKIWAFARADDGALSDRRLVYDFAPGRGGDGMAIDHQGMLYIAAGVQTPRGAFETSDVPPGIYCMTPAGGLLGRIPIPQDLITNVTFGGPDLRTLWITAGNTLFTHRTTTPGFVIHRRSAG